MSDETAPTSAPLDAPEAAAPAEPVEKVEAKPRTADDDFEDLLKKNGGLKYKAKGKEKSVGNVADLRRLLSSRDEIDAVASDALKRTQEADGLKSKLAAIEKLPPRERISALQAAGINPKLIREAYEEQILEEDAKARQQAGMSQEQRAFLADKEKFEAERNEYQAEQQRVKEAQEQEAYVAKISETGKRLESVTVAALQKAKISGEQAPHFIQAIAAQLDRNERLGLGLDENDIADVVMAEQEKMATGWIQGRSPVDLADTLDSMELPDPERPEKKTTLGRLLMLEYAKRINAKRGSVPGTNGTPQRTSQQSNGNAQTFAEKMAAARTFGGR